MITFRCHSTLFLAGEFPVKSDPSPPLTALIYSEPNHMYVYMQILSIFSFLIVKIKNKTSF